MRSNLISTIKYLFILGLVLTTSPASAKSGGKILAYNTSTLDLAMKYIGNYYMDSEKLDPRTLLTGAIKKLEVEIPPFMAKVKEDKVEMTIDRKDFSVKIKKELLIDDLPEILGEILKTIIENYDGPATPEETEETVLTGITAELDPHSSYLPAKVYKEFKIGTKGNFGGLGIVIGLRDNYLTVIAPLEGTPAYKAGIKAKDKIIQIGDESTINMSLTEAVEKLRGRPGTKVSLLAQREGVSEPLHFELTRAIIKIDSVKAELIEGSIGLVRIKSFQEDTTTELEKSFKQLRAKNGNLKGLILDLRNNPGGLLDQAVMVTDKFLKKGVIVSTETAKKQKNGQEFANLGDGEETTPLVVLVNEGSASASEIVAGALQKHDRALILGNQTFGKGTVQSVLDLRDGSALKLTIAQYLLSGDVPVQSIGIIPDITLVPVTVSEKGFDLIENKSYSEIDLTKEKRIFIAKSPERLKYLGKAEDNTGDDEMSGIINMEEDFPVKLAVKIIEEEASLTRNELFNTAVSILEDIKKEEEKKISERLKKSKIDWGKTAVKNKPMATLSFEIKNAAGEVVKKLKPGESASLKLSVFNKGQGALQQLSATTECEDTFFNDLEFVFGAVPPQESRESKTDVTIPDFFPARKVPVKIIFGEGNGNVPKSFETEIEITDSPLPLFKYKYSMIDDGTLGSKGNGDGRVHAGETIAFRFTVENMGGKEAGQPVVNLKSANGESLSIKKGRVILDPLKPGKREDAVMLVAIKESREELDLNLEIRDMKLPAFLSDTIKLKFGEAPLRPVPNKFQEAPSITWDKSFPLITNKNICQISGIAKDDKKVKEVYIFTNDEKVYYKSNNGDDPNIIFSADLPLKKGPNRVMIIASDSDERIGSRQLYLWKK